MEVIQYLGFENLVKELSKKTNARPGFCSGYRFLQPESLLVDIPQPSIHYDESRRCAVTVLCRHGFDGINPHCQDFAEILFPLITSFARKPVGLEVWLDLFPSLGNGNNDFVDPAHPFCMGLMRAHSDKQTIPPRVRPGIELNVESSLVPTLPCSHSPCQPALPYIMAVLRAFGLGMLKNVGYEANGVDKNDILYVTEGFSWGRTFAEAEPTPHGDILLLRNSWPQVIYPEIKDCIIWSPHNLIKEDDHSIDKENSGMSPPPPSPTFKIKTPLSTPKQETAFIYPECFQETHKTMYGPFRSGSPRVGMSNPKSAKFAFPSKSCSRSGSSFPSKPYSRGGAFQDTSLKLKMMGGDPADIRNATISSHLWNPPASTNGIQMVTLSRTSSNGNLMWCNFSLMRDGLRVMSFICDEMLQIANEDQKSDLRNVIINNYKKCGE